MIRNGNIVDGLIPQIIPYKNYRYIEHRPKWVPTELQYNAAGDTKPGFKCEHELENGNGLCEGAVFHPNDGLFCHGCVVDTKDWKLRQAKKRKINKRTWRKR